MCYELKVHQKPGRIILTICIYYLQGDELISLPLFLTKILNVTTCCYFTLAFLTSAEMKNQQQGRTLRRLFQMKIDTGLFEMLLDQLWKTMV